MKFLNIYIDNWIQKKGKKNIYRIAKAKERNTKDLAQIRYIKDEYNRVLLDNEKIKKMMMKYF